MAEVQWIRLVVGMFDGNSFKKIKRAKIGGVSYRDKLTAVWVELLDLAGKSNANGYLIDNNNIPYSTFEDIATQLDRDEKEIELCMQFFIKEKMVEIIEDVYCLTNFIKYQNQDGLEKIREQTRKRVAKHREKKLLAQSNATSNVTVTLRNAIEEEKEEDLEKEFHSIVHSNAREEEPMENFDSREEVRLKYLGGKLGKGVVLLSDEQTSDLLDKLSIEEFNKYVEIVADEELKGHHYKKTHYQAILDMVKHDRRKK